MVDPLAAVRADLARSGRVTLVLKVIPKSSRNQIAGLLPDGSMKVKITAAPEKGKANAALCDFLAHELGVSRGAVEIVRGGTSQLKQVVITLR